jgi:hypothetical protein
MGEPGLADRVQRLEDRAEITDLLVRYATGIRTVDGALVASCFSDDARIELGTGTSVEGRTAMDEYFLQSMRNEVFARPPLRLDPRIVSTPVVNNVSIELAGDSARCTSVGLAIHGGVRADAQGSSEILMIRGSVYDDELVRTEDGWRIRIRRQKTFWQLEVPAVEPLRRP